MSKRSKMMASVVREVIAPVLRECPPECGMVSITGVVVSDDFSFATVYLSALQEPEAALAFLEDQAKALKAKLHQMERRRIPALRFRLDEQLEEGNRVEELLNELE